VGSTTAFRQRKNQHKSRCYNEKNKCYTFKVYQFIRDNGGWDNWEMIQIKSVNVNNKRELEGEERTVIEELNPSLNCSIPIIYCDRKEYVKDWCEKNKEHKNEYNRQRYYEKKDDIVKKKREYYEKNKDRLLQQCKEYREKNKEKIAEYQREYGENNKEKIAQLKREYRARKKLIDPQ
jgi:hypothetical protein